MLLNRLCSDAWGHFRFYTFVSPSPWSLTTWNDFWATSGRWRPCFWPFQYEKYFLIGKSFTVRIKKGICNTIIVRLVIFIQSKISAKHKEYSLLQRQCPSINLKYGSNILFASSTNMCMKWQLLIKKTRFYMLRVRSRRLVLWIWNGLLAAKIYLTRPKL